MKKLVALALLLSGLCATANSFTVSGTPVSVLPPRPLVNAQLWAEDLVGVSGQVFKLSNSTFVQLTANIAALPANPTANYVSVFSGSRGFATVQNHGPQAAWLQFGASAVANRFLKLLPGATVSVDDYQGLVSAVSEGTSTITVTEVPSAK